MSNEASPTPDDRRRWREFWIAVGGGLFYLIWGLGGWALNIDNLFERIAFPLFGLIWLVFAGFRWAALRRLAGGNEAEPEEGSGH